jgi:hypothetical protein
MKLFAGDLVFVSKLWWNMGFWYVFKRSFVRLSLKADSMVLLVPRLLSRNL